MSCGLPAASRSAASTGTGDAQERGGPIRVVRIERQTPPVHIQPFRAVQTDRQHQPPAGGEQGSHPCQCGGFVPDVKQKQRRVHAVEGFPEGEGHEIAAQQGRVAVAGQMCPCACDSGGGKVDAGKMPASRCHPARQPSGADTRLQHGVRAVQGQQFHERRPVPAFHVCRQCRRIQYGIVVLRNQGVIMVGQEPTFILRSHGVSPFRRRGTPCDIPRR